MPVFIIIHQSRHWKPLRSIFEETVHVEHPTIAELVNRSFTDDECFMNESDFEALPDHIQKRFSKEKWIIGEVKGLGDSWEKNN